MFEVVYFAHMTPASWSSALTFRVVSSEWCRRIFPRSWLEVLLRFTVVNGKARQEVLEVHLLDLPRAGFDGWQSDSLVVEGMCNGVGELRHRVAESRGGPRIVKRHQLRHWRDVGKQVVVDQGGAGGLEAEGIIEVHLR